MITGCFSQHGSRKRHEAVRFDAPVALAGWGAGRMTGATCGASVMTSVKILAVSLVIAASAGAAEARTPINQEAHINDTLRQGFIADAIADNCPTMRPRKLRALNELTKLRDYALKQGYTRQEITAFVESKTEKKRGKAEAAAWLKKAGAEPGKVQAYCTVGETEIARNSLIGYLLRSTR